MFLIYSQQTGAELRRQAGEDCAPGEGAFEIPPSATLDPPLSEWSPALRGFVEPILVDAPTMRKLLTDAEIAAMCSAPAMMPVVLQWLFMIAAGEPQRINSPLHIGTGAAMREAGILSLSRHAQFVAGIPASAS